MIKFSNHRNNNLTSKQLFQQLNKILENLCADHYNFQTIFAQINKLVSQNRGWIFSDNTTLVLLLQQFWRKTCSYIALLFKNLTQCRFQFQLSICENIDKIKPEDPLKILLWPLSFQHESSINPRMLHLKPIFHYRE